ncbi:MAG TPA: GDP-mannose 4,6-dehydratase [Terriglobia bacterium]|jgi:GDPmannose 4,6-dehydratase
MSRKALITGITGQDGSYLAEFLLEKGYEVHGIVRRVAIEDPDHRLLRIRHILDRINLHAASLESYPSLYSVMTKVKPDEVYHLAAQSFVSYSFEDEFSTLGVNISGTHYVLAAVRDLVPQARLYFAATSEMFGNTETYPQNENTPFRPRSAYGISKLAGYHLCRNYREAYGLHISSGILYNHESPRRGFEFVTRKITSQAAKIKLGLEKTIRLGNLDAKRDWGHAREYVKVMWLMLQQDKPDDYVIATEKTHSVREFLEATFKILGLDPYKHLVIDPDLLRPAEIHILVGNSTKARINLGWTYDLALPDLIEEMVTSDLSYYTSSAHSGSEPAKKT